LKKWKKQVNSKRKKNFHNPSRTAMILGTSSWKRNPTTTITQWMTSPWTRSCTWWPNVWCSVSCPAGTLISTNSSA
jgi:hypothetical protein